MSKITVIGSFVMDLIGIVNEFPLAGQTVIGKSMKTFHGGKGANQAVSAARLGGKVSMVGMVGNDDYGNTFKFLLKKENIDMSCVLTSQIEPTGVGLIQVNRLGENKIVVIPGANYEYSINDLEAVKEQIKKSGIVITQLELKHEVTFRLINLCDELNVPIIVNPAPAIKIQEEYYSKITYLTPNETELGILSGISIKNMEDVKRAIKELLNRGVKNVVVTLGSKGAIIGTQGGFQYVEGFKVNVVDTVGAGDAFNGALAYGIANKNKKLLEVVKHANAVGALSVTKRGAIPSLPTKEQVSCFVNYHKKLTTT
ncbi:MAG: ribokinase [Clostridiales bacterium]|nr:ribokinase [Clostridiales bacterium]